jgi:hypothetical protein
MNARNTVWVERVEGSIRRIFRSTHGEDWSRAMAAETLETCPKRDAISAIRAEIWKRGGGRCEWCGKPVTESGPLHKRMHMHEVIPKGNGGQVALDNSAGICYDCHFGDPRAHGNRRPQFSGKSVEEIMEE